MAGKHSIPQRMITMAHQQWHMKRFFPELSFDVRKSSWIGELTPTSASDIYRVEINYRLGKIPKVLLIEPRVNPESPHLFADLSLCLYWPKDRSWDSTCLIKNTIVPWTAEWLLFYEYWQIHNKWIGQSAPHGLQPYKKPINKGIDL